MCTFAKMRSSSVEIEFSFIVICFCAYFSKVSSNSNVPKEITELFNAQNKNMTVTEKAGPLGLIYNKMYAEGSSSTVNTNNREISRIESDSPKQLNKSDVIQPKNEEHNLTHLNNDSLLKFDTTVLHLNLTNIDKIIHGTSSIKPRKGVSYNKVVPKKGVNYEDYLKNSLPSNHSCFFFNKSNCYDVDYYYSSLVCNCCNKTNDLGEIISRQPLINCSKCTPVNDVNVEFCTGICCTNIIQTTTGKHGVNITKNIDKLSGTHEFLNFSVINENHVQKKKPVVTNVPYDSDTSNPFSKSKGEKYVPIIVSIFILPLVGILIFFLWKKTQELWDRRYYKRMDFLIDGMYNE